jgi:hypothetical protein
MHFTCWIPDKKGFVVAQPTVTISSPTGNTAIPTGATGNASPSAGYQLSGMAYQIDSGSVNSLPSTAYPAGGGVWNFQLQTSDCPTIGQQYLLTVYAGDTSGNFNTAAVTITRTS